jgi:hypothetical protein
MTTSYRQLLCDARLFDRGTVFENGFWNSGRTFCIRWAITISANDARYDFDGGPTFAFSDFVSPHFFFSNVFRPEPTSNISNSVGFCR